jgi:hypothetical protein
MTSRVWSRGSRVARHTCRGACLALLLATLAPRAATLHAQSHVLIVSGLGGAPQYTKSFKEWGATLATTVRQRFALPESAVVYLNEDASGGARGRSTREEIEGTLERFRAGAGANDQLVVVLIGHGTPEGADSKITLPGPDMTAANFAAVLAKWTSQRIAFVNLTSASGDFLPVISGANRVVITATKSSFERNESVFAQHFVDALAKDGADVDKDGRVSLLEAYRYAAAETKRHYEASSRLQTEHAQLDDDGDRKGVPEPAAQDGDGLLARRFFLDTPGRAVAVSGAADSQLAVLYKDKSALEERLDALKKRKSGMTAAAYDDALEDVLVQLARKAIAIRQMEGRGQ